MKENNSIQCSVSKCIHHSDNENYCILKQIVVNKDRSSNVSVAQCASFEIK